MSTDSRLADFFAPNPVVGKLAVDLTDGFPVLTWDPPDTQVVMVPRELLELLVNKYWSL